MILVLQGVIIKKSIHFVVLLWIFHPQHHQNVWENPRLQYDWINIYYIVFSLLKRRLTELKVSQYIKVSKIIINFDQKMNP